MSDEIQGEIQRKSNLRKRPNWTSKDQPKGKRGRPKGALSLGNMLRKYLSDNGKEKASRVIESTAELCIKGHPVAMKTVWDRIDGVIDQEIDLKGNVTFQVINYGDKGKDKKPKGGNGSKG